ncbi:hypothetical protein [Oricola sp.]|uniref:hypothetical protein n=1 Tax=Oricola sp. TaxID=1979950 RepID=UPI003BA9EDED
MDIAHFVAACGSLFIAAVHVFAGGPAVAAPIAAAEELDPVVRDTDYYCWHLVTISLLVMAAAFLWSAFHPGAWELAVAGTAMAATYSLWGIGLAVARRQRFRDLPQGLMFLPVALAGLAGHLA